MNKARYSIILCKVQFLTSLGFGVGLTSLKIKREQKEKCLQLLFLTLSFIQPFCY